MFNFSRWLRQTFRHSARRPHLAPRRKTPTRPQLEQLENRMVLSSWTAIGPAPIGSGGTPSGTPVSGRITGVAADTTNANTLYAAAAGGGIWKSTNGGNSWASLTDNVTDGSGNPVPLFMGAIAETQDSNHNQILYAGTGEANNAIDSFYGEGILVSRNGGATWTLTTGPSDAFNRTTVSKIAIDPSDATGATAYAAVAGGGTNGLDQNTGIWKTTNFGQTWTNTTAAAPNNLSAVDPWSDVVIDPLTDTLYAAEGNPNGSAGNGVYKSIDGGATWTLLNTGPTGVNEGRIALAVFDNGITNELLVAVAGDGGTSFGELRELDKSTNGGVTFTKLASTPNYMGQSGFGQGWYDTTLAIDPADANYIYAGGSDNGGSNGNVESFDGGTTWQSITADSLGNGPHTDDHAAAFDANGNLIDGNDGGLFRLNNPTNVNTQTWDDLNTTNLQITQFTGVALDPTTATVAYGGNQDNGTAKYTGTKNWTEIVGGDGGITRVDPTNHNTVYQEFTDVSLEVSTDGGSTFNDITTGISANTENFYTPYVLDSAGNVYFGSDFLNFSSNHGSSWSQIGTPGTHNFNPNDFAIDSVAVSSGDNNVVYVSAGGSTFVTKNAQAGGNNVTWTQVNLSNGIAGTYAANRNSIAVDPSDATGGTAYAVVNAFEGGGNHVFKTTNFGSTWTDVSANLPDTPCNSVAVSADGKTVWVGTDVGVYATTDGGTTWAPFGSGFPNAQVVELEDMPSLHVLGAGTHGRGMFEISDVITALGSLTINAPPATEHFGFSGFTLATFTDSQSGVTAGAFTATITWGDGTSSTLSGTAGSIVSTGNGNFALVAGHTYAEEGTKTLSVQVRDNSGNSVSGNTSVAVADALLTLTAVNPPSGSLTEGVTSATFTVATFTDGALGTDVSDFTATVTWGDGTSSKAAVVNTGAGTFAVKASHAFAEEGSTPSLSVAVADVGGSFAIGRSSSFNVADHPLANLTIRNTAATEGKGTNLITVATFVDNTLASTTDFTATITWGDGNTATLSGASGAFVKGGNGQFSLLASHTYAEEGTYTLSVHILDDGGASIAGSRTISVADAGLFSPGLFNPHTTEGKGTGTFTVATFADHNAAALARDFAATITWGDGTTSTLSGATGGIVAAGGKFALRASHTYAEEGNYTLSVQVRDDGGASISGSLTIAVADAALSSLTLSKPSATEGKGTGTFTVATFTDKNTSAPASDFTAVVQWGDGGTSTLTGSGIVSLGGGGFAVLSSHTYAEEGSYTLSVQVLDDGGASVSGSEKVTVADQPLSNLTLTSIQATEGKGTGTLRVATFHDSNQSASASDFTATITWADGNTTTVSGATGGIVFLGNGNFAVNAGHTYAEEGSYSLSVQILDDGGASISTTRSLTVTDAGLFSLGLFNPHTTEGKGTGTFTVATFADRNAAALASDFTATITWGDGSTTTVSGATGGIVAVGGGKFALRASHTYADEGSYTLSVQVLDDGGATLSGGLTLSVADAALASLSVKDPHATHGVDTGTFTVATFHDNNLGAPTGDFTAVIHWGDGTTTTLQAADFVSQGNGNFAVLASHLYATAGSVTLSVTVDDDGGASVSGSLKITVA